MKTFKVLNIRNVLGMVIAFLSQHAYGQHKTEEPMREQQKGKDTVEVAAEGLKVSQMGSGNRVEVNQSSGRSSVFTTIVTERNGNRILYHSANTDSIGQAHVEQSGSGNSVVIRQSGPGNSIRLRQSSEKKTDE